MTWSREEWAAAAASPDWSAKVANALVHYFDQGEWLLEPATLIGVSTESDADGTPVLRAIYDHPYWSERTGLRRRLDQIPTTSQEGESPDESKARWIAVFEISEPLGTFHRHLVSDEEGVWWWGDGYGVGEGL